MELQIAKWGNSLAIHIPAKVVHQMGLSDGEHVQADVTSNGVLTTQRQKFDRKKHVAQLREMHKTVKKGTSVIEELRRGKEARY